MNLYTSYDLEKLADKMIESIIDCWKEPLNPPIVIFANRKYEQWFKLFWLKQEKNPKHKILLNLNFKNLESFLFESLVSKNDDKKYQNLTFQLLKDLIVFKLPSIYKLLNNKNIENYIEKTENQNTVIDRIKLEDLANQLSKLYFIYEESNFEANGWQKTLFDEILKNESKLVTAKTLFEKNKNMFKNLSKNQIFLFGFAEITPFQIDLLKKYDEQSIHKISIYSQFIQNNGKNSFLKKYSESANAYIKSWNIKPTVIDDLESKNDSILHIIQNHIKNDNEIEKNSVNKNENLPHSITFSTAPSKLREIELLHTRICKLLQQDDVDLSDFLVVAPKIQDYAVTIYQVFNQDSKKDESINEKAEYDYPNIPIKITDFITEHSAIAEALSIILDVLQKGYFTRADFFKLVHNYVIQNNLGFDDNFVSAWSKWISSLNVYRNRNIYNENDVNDVIRLDDWRNAANRILLSRLTDEKIVEYGESRNEIFSIYSDLNSQDNDKLYKFVDTIDLLEKLISLKKEKDLSVDRKKLYLLQNCLDKLLLIKNNNKKLLSEKIVYQSTVQEFLQLKELISKNGKIHFDSVIQSISNSIRESSFSSGSVFSSGITFMSISPEKILPAKYIFFIGLDSKSYPGRNIRNVLDERDENHLLQERTKKNENAFLNLFMSAKKGFHISYVNKNLQKDENYFISPISKDLLEYANNFAQIKEIEESIDETRSWSELYTRSAFRNKENYQKLINVKNQFAKKIESQENSQNDYKYLKNDIEVPETITIAKLKSFLEEPFQFQITNILSQNYDDDEASEEIIEYEPIELNNLNKAVFKKKYVQTLLERFRVSGDYQKEIVKNDMKLNLEQSNSIPDGIFGKNTIEHLEIISLSISDTILNILNENVTLTFGDKANVTIDSDDSDDTKFKLTGKRCWYSKNQNELIVIDIKSEKSTCDFISAFLTSLSIVAENIDDEKNDVTLYLIDSNKGSQSSRKMTLSKTEAKEILKKIFNEAYKEKYKVCIPFKEIETKTKDDFDYFDFASNLKGEHGSWTYFSKANLFDVFRDSNILGYDIKNFKDEYEKAKEHQKELVKVLIESEKN